MFLQPDWWEVTWAGVGTNRYSYAGGDPINRLDPNGNGWLQDAWNDFKSSVKNSFKALGDALSGNVEHINNAGQPGTGGNYGVVHIGGTTYGCFGCSGTGITAALAVGDAQTWAAQKNGLDADKAKQTALSGHLLSHTNGLVASIDITSWPQILQEIWETPGVPEFAEKLLALSQAEQVEFATIFYRSQNGAIAHGPIYRGTYADIEIPGKRTTGAPLGLLHTHWTSGVSPSGKRMIPYPSSVDLKTARDTKVGGLVYNWMNQVWGYWW